MFIIVHIYLFNIYMLVKFIYLILFPSSQKFPVICTLKVKKKLILYVVAHMRCYLIDRYSCSPKSTYSLYVVAHIRGGSLTQKSTYKDLTSLANTKST